MEMCETFQDLTLIKVQDRVVNPLLDVWNRLTGDARATIKNDIELFKESYKDFLLQKISKFCPVLWNKVIIYFIVIPTSHIW